MKTYSNGEVTITWEPEKCIHSGNCVKGLPSVFDSKKKPWINVDGATSAQMVNQVKKCPTGALGYFYNDQEEKIEATETKEENIVEVVNNGPLMVYGNLEVKYKDGSSEKKHKVTAFCRCGASQNKPYCDGTHKKIGFEG